MPLSDRQLAEYLAEQIRLVLIHAHLDDCECNTNIQRSCGWRRLEMAFREYCHYYPGEIF